MGKKALITSITDQDGPYLAEFFLDKMETYNDIMTQKEIELSSWFGFSIIIRKDHLEPDRA